MKILLVCQCFYPENFRVNDLCSELVRRGHEVTVLAGIPINRTTGRFWDGYGRKERIEDTFEGARVVRAYNTQRHHDSVHLAIHYFSFWFFGNKKAKRLAKQEKFDIVLVYQLSPVFMAFPAIKVARMQHISLITYTLDLWPESAINAGGLNFKPIITWLRRKVDKIYRASDKILISSRHFKDLIVENGHPAEKIEFFPQYAEDCYVKLDKNPEDPIENELPQGFRIIFTGNIGRSQSIETVVEAAAELKGYPDIHWIIVGDGRDRDKVFQYTEEMGVTENVHFTGRKPMETMSRYLAASDVALLILRDDPLFHITLPAKAQSYMACGKPILGCIKGESANLIQEAKCGVCCSEINGKSLAEAALKMYELSPGERAQMGQNAASYSQQYFSKQKLLDRLEEMMGELT